MTEAAKTQCAFWVGPEHSSAFEKQVCNIDGCILKASESQRSCCPVPAGLLSAITISAVLSTGH